VTSPSPARPATDPVRGLTAAEVAERIARGEVNVAPDARSRSLSDIVRANTFTWFNGLIGSLWIVMLLVAPIQDSLFGFVIVFNMAIGIVQEYRAARTLARLSVLGEARPTVRRDGIDAQVAKDDVVLDDVIVLAVGDQLVVDGVVLASDGLEIDESLLTGEADPVDKASGDEAMSAQRPSISSSGISPRAKRSSFLRRSAARSSARPRTTAVSRHKNVKMFFQSVPESLWSTNTNDRVALYCIFSRKKNIAARADRYDVLPFQLEAGLLFMDFGHGEVSEPGADGGEPAGELGGMASPTDAETVLGNSQSVSQPQKNAVRGRQRRHRLEQRAEHQFVQSRFRSVPGVLLEFGFEPVRPGGRESLASLQGDQAVDRHPEQPVLQAVGPGKSTEQIFLRLQKTFGEHFRGHILGGGLGRPARHEAGHHAGANSGLEGIEEIRTRG